MTYIMTNEFASFGQSAGFSPAVEKLQKALQRLATAQAEPLYYPGRADGDYGLNTHAAFIRVARDLLGWTAGPGCQSLCNTLRASSESSCAACIKQALSQFSTLPAAEASFSATEASQVANAYSAFLAAYLASYGDAVGDGGTVVDPSTTDMPPGVPADLPLDPVDYETPGDDALAPSDGAPVVTPDEDGGGGEDVFTDSGVQRAGFSWGWLVVGVVVVGGLIGGAYWMSTREEDQKLSTSPSTYPRISASRPRRKATKVVFSRARGGRRPRAVVQVY